MSAEFPVEHPYVAQLEQAIREAGVCEGCPAMTRLFEEVGDLVVRAKLDRSRTDEQIEVLSKDYSSLKMARLVDPEMTARENAYRLRKIKLTTITWDLNGFKTSIEQSPCRGGLTSDQAIIVHPPAIDYTPEQTQELEAAREQMLNMLGDNAPRQLPMSKGGYYCEIDVRNERALQKKRLNGPAE